MNLKTIVLTGILAAGIPVAAQAQEKDDLNNYRVSCNAGAECSNFKVNYEDDTVAQTRRTRTRRTRSSSVDSKYYGGATLGVAFPGSIDGSSVDGGTGLGGSVYGGYKFTERISADAEALLAFGSNDINAVDGSYTLFGGYINPRYTYTINEGEPKSPFVFASPGVGFANYGIGGDVGDAIDAADLDDSASGLAIQGKVGAGYPVTEKIDLIGQARYQYIFSAIDVPETQIDGTVDENSEGLGIFGIEIGANYKF